MLDTVKELLVNLFSNVLNIIITAAAAIVILALMWNYLIFAQNSTNEKSKSFNVVITGR